MLLTLVSTIVAPDVVELALRLFARDLAGEPITSEFSHVSNQPPRPA